MEFVVVREKGFTIQCMVTFVENVVNERMMKFAFSLSREPVVDVEGVVSLPKNTVKRATQQVEIQVRKLFCVNKDVCTVPFLIEDAARSEVDIENSLETGKHLVHVNQDTRLKFKTHDLCMPFNQAIFCVQDAVEHKLVQFLRSEGFVATHTPKLIAGASLLESESPILV